MFARAHFVAIVVVLAVAPAACGSSSWDQSVERARARGEPLIVEFYAEWCAPCRRFEQVLQDPEVVRALGAVEVMRYDFDSTAGQHHARRLGVSAVPTVLAVGADGRPFGGLRGAVDKARFLDFLAWSRVQRDAPVANP